MKHRYVILTGDDHPDAIGFICLKCARILWLSRLKVRSIVLGERGYEKWFDRQRKCSN